ncbi:hypothetical protein DSOUD_0111 [Desulfuromonas soudanensis]|uniref:Outer membrane lipoprotein-sorting protein n=1 Tax=Desulfuromonas soudanensis TaxID=1603606 RepID=A0A0M4DEF0_9BACT|nr:hypothetical protein [Desulfuromonas soudanensis]ALC14912.1 hypothetical protein DSOUD_0111 [Desulfuromonas soudanensis]
MQRIFSKGITIILMIAWCLPTHSFAAAGEKEFKNLLSTPKVISRVQIHTAYNMFTENRKVQAINFRVGGIIPAGTPVTVEIVEPSLDDRSLFAMPEIRFTTLSDNINYTLKFTERYHPGKTVYDYANLMFGVKTFGEITEGKSADVIDAIRRSAVIEGMTKEEVLISYGYPAEHRTPSLLANTWIYWENRHTEKKICFSEEELAISCKKLKSEDL